MQLRLLSHAACKAGLPHCLDCWGPTLKSRGIAGQGSLQHSMCSRLTTCGPGSQSPAKHLQPVTTLLPYCQICCSTFICFVHYPPGAMPVTWSYKSSLTLCTSPCVPAYVLHPALTEGLCKEMPAQTTWYCT